ncbi:MAG TPA: hypothetical protein VEY30_13915, partial [Myxococcaceae bacterium]|nr:hypothetical protein [Myxococcaceae bacterium]
MSPLITYAALLAVSQVGGKAAVDPITGEKRTGTPAPAASASPAAAPAPPAAKADPKLFEQALQSYFAQDPRNAAGKLYRFIEGSPSTDENYAWAQLFLGKSLIELGLHHAGAVYLAQVARERSNPAVLPRALEALLKLTDAPHDEVMIDE